MYKTTVQRRCDAGRLMYICTVSCTVTGKAAAYELQAAARLTFTSFHLTSANIHLVVDAAFVSSLSFLPNGYTPPNR